MLEEVVAYLQRRAVQLDLAASPQPYKASLASVPASFELLCVLGLGSLKRGLYAFSK